MVVRTSTCVPGWSGRGYVSLVGLLEMLGTALCSCGVYMYVKSSLVQLVSTRAATCLTLAEPPM